MADPARAAKMADRIKVIVAKTLERGLKDPRLGFVTITDVKVTGDLQHASIFYTVYGSDEERTDSAAALKSATVTNPRRGSLRPRSRVFATITLMRSAILAARAGSAITLP